MMGYLLLIFLFIISKIESKEVMPTGIVFTPTAYRINGKEGLNCDFLFNFPIGNFIEKTKINNKIKVENLVPIKVLVVGSDFKYSILKRRGGFFLALGSTYSFIWQGVGASPEGFGGVIKGENLNSFNYFYSVCSKSLKNIDIHLGILYGDIKKILNTISTGFLLNINTKTTPFIGLSLPLFKKRRLNIEALIRYEKKNIYLLANTYIPRFIGFNLGMLFVKEKEKEGYYLTGYIFERFSLYPFKNK